MKQAYRDLFDEVHASQHLRQEVLQMTEQKQAPRRQFPKRLLIAAAVLAVLAGTAVAAVGGPATLRDWFGRTWEESTGAPMETQQMALIDELTRPVGASDTQNGVTVTVDSITVGNSNLWLLLKISGEYPEEENVGYNFDGMDLTIDPDPDQVDTPGGAGMSYPYSGVAEDGRLTLLVHYTIDLAGQSSLLEEPRQVTLKMDNLERRDLTTLDDPTTLAEGSWTITFPLEAGEAGGELTLEEIQVPAINRDAQETKEITLRDVSLTATDLSFCQAAEDQSWEPEKCVLVLQDGSEVNWSSGTSRFWDEAQTQWGSVWYWQVPVDLSQAAALRFGDTEIPLT